ncbi:MAG: ATP-dependent Clp protease adaptor ClpS [Chitinophagales bacterium]
MHQLSEIQLEELLLADDTGTDSALIVHNDSINTFDWVIQALVEICRHTEHQAEQCSYIIHHKGKYAVKHGPLHVLREMRTAIVERGIQATIE